MDVYLVAEYPKSGGSWVSQILSDYLNLPYPRNVSPKIEESVVHGHHLYSPTYGKALAVFRDGRDVVVSAYFHRLFHSDRNVPWQVERTRAQLGFDDYEDIGSNLPGFIKFLFNEDASGPFRFSWADFVESWMASGRPIVYYEDLLEDTVAALRDVLEQLVGESVNEARLTESVERYTFERLTGRARGEEQRGSFVRKGVAGDWKSKFTPEAGEVFARYAGDALVAAGYEHDHSWVDKLTSAAGDNGD